MISVILGNALDNAIKACRNEKNVERHITIHIHYLNESLFLRIQNPYVHNIRKNFYGEIRSTKSDSPSHGLGLKSIIKIVEDNFMISILLKLRKDLSGCVCIHI